MMEFLSCFLGLFFVLGVFFLYVDCLKICKKLNTRLTDLENEFEVYAIDVDRLMDEVF